MAHVEERWGFTPLPPGQYRVSLLPKGYHTLELPWAEVTVVAGKTATVKIDSGVDLVGRAKGDRPLSQWEVLDLKTQKPVSHVEERWGFTPMPPGEYAVSGGPHAFPWAEVKVASGQVVTVCIPDVPERLGRVMRVGEKDGKGARSGQLQEIGRTDREGHPARGGVAQEAGPVWQVPAGPQVPYPPSESSRSCMPGNSSATARRIAASPICWPSAERLRGQYANSLTAMALRDWDPSQVRQRVFECALWLVENQGWEKARPMWGYGDTVPGIGDDKKATDEPAEGRPLEVIRRGLVTKPNTYWDNSNTQFAVLALHSAAHSGIKIPTKSGNGSRSISTTIRSPTWEHPAAGATSSSSTAA